MTPPDHFGQRQDPDQGEGDEALPDLLKAPLDPSNSGAQPGEGGDICGSS